jgi:hypothetical protein
VRRRLGCGARILVCVVAALYAGLRFRAAGQAALYELDLALDLVEFGVCLEPVRIARACGGLDCDRTSPSSTEATRIMPRALSALYAIASSGVATDRRDVILSCA